MATSASANSGVTERNLRIAIAPITEIEVRDASQTGDGSWTIGGYAAVFSQPTTLYDGRFIRLREVIEPGAFSRAGKDASSVMSRVASGEDTVRLNYMHDSGSSVASTEIRVGDGGQLPIGGLQLAEDAHGLRFFARVDVEDPDAQRMAVKMRRGVVKQASFAFTVADEEIVITNDGNLEDEFHRILAVQALYDVCACPAGAYEGTESYVRSLAFASLGRGSLDLPGFSRHEDFSGGAPVAPAVEGSSVIQPSADLIKARVTATYARRSRNGSS